jgi:RHS repeat-associated protein
MPVAAIYGTKHYAIQSDHLNTPRRLIQSDGQVAWQWAYSAFGEEKPTIAKTRFANADLNQSFGSTAVPAVTFNLRYPGQYFDQESGLHYNYHRSYSATMGRYTQSDPIGLDGGWNRFGYAEQNPMRYSDPLGLDTCRTVANLIFASVQLCTPTPPIPGRPGSMSPKEEKYYDRHCAGTDDPCAALKLAVWKAIEQAKIKMINMLDDKLLFRNAYKIPNPAVTGTNTTWLGHVDDLDGRIASIWIMISLGRKLGCDMSSETAAALTLLTPGAPRN